MKMKGKYGEIVRSDRTFDVIAAVLGCIIIVIVMVPLIFGGGLLFRSGPGHPGRGAALAERADDEGVHHGV